MNTEKSQGQAQLAVQEPQPPWADSTAKPGPDVMLMAAYPIQLTAEDWRKYDDDGHFDRARGAVADEVGMRVRRAREGAGLSRVDLGKALHVHENTVAKIERGQSHVEVVTLLQIAALTNRPLTWFLGDESADSPEEDHVPRNTTALERGQMVYVPLFDVRAAAGNGAFNDQEAVLHMRAFGQDYIRRALHILHNDLALITVVGTSAEPELHAGDVVLIDRRDREIHVEGLHLIRVDSGLMVKMVQRLPGGVLRVFSKNQRTSPFDINVADGTHNDFEVLGRVRWGGVTFN